MDYLKQFEKNFWNGDVHVHEHYCSPTRTNRDKLNIGINSDKSNSDKSSSDKSNIGSSIGCDVIDDIVDYNRPISAACLPIAKQIVKLLVDQHIPVKIPRIGDIFIGILDQLIIEKVTFIIHNNIESISIDGILKTFGQQKIWVLTHQPIPMICLGDSESIYLSANIYINSNYSLQNSNQDVFKAFYGYFSRPIQYQITQQIIYELPLYDEIHNMKIICGFWTIDEMK